VQSFNIGGCESCQGFKTDAFDKHMMHHSTLCTLALLFLVKLRFWEQGKLRPSIISWIFWDSFLESFLSSVLQFSCFKRRVS
jgi:hypothetical protein